jgi:hypothetical protein
MKEIKEIENLIKWCLMLDISILKNYCAKSIVDNHFINK